MIKALSPYWLYIPFVSPTTGLTCTNFTLQVFVWDGAKGSVPVTSSFEITKSNPTGSTSSSRVNIANLVSDFVDFTQQEGVTTELINGNNQNWVKYQTFYATTNPLDASTPSNVNTNLMLRGYSYGMDGENQSIPLDKILLSGEEFKVSRNSVFVLPILIDEEAVPVLTLTITDVVFNAGDNYNIFFTISGFTDNLFSRYRLQGTIEWTISSTVGTGVSPEIAEMFLTTGTWEIQIFGYDDINAITVYSNIYEKIIA